MNLSAALREARIVPVVVIDDAGRAADLGAAIAAGGLRVVEVTLRTEAAAAAIGKLSGADDLLVGAGTVLNVAQVEQAVDAGADFLVSPGMSRAVVARAQQLEVPILPGVSDSTGIMAALDLGVDVVKLFPAGVLGGTAAVRALAGPFPQVRFVPTGGVDGSNAADYLALASVSAVGGSWMVPRQAIAAGAWQEITELTARAVALAKGCER